MTMLTYTTDAPIVIVGEGKLYDAVWASLSAAYDIISQDLHNVLDRPFTGSLLLYCDDLWRPELQQQLNRYCLDYGVSWLRAYTEFGRGIIGPFILPGAPGCVTCEVTRRQGASGDPNYFMLGEVTSQPDASPRRTWQNSFSVAIMTQLITSEVERFFQNRDRILTRAAVISLDLSTLHVKRRQFLPVSDCPDCSQRPDDSAEAAVITLTEQQKMSPQTYRTRTLTASDRQMFATYVDAQVGMVSDLATVTASGASCVCITAQIASPSFKRWPRRVVGIGRGISHQQSRVSAIAEALERYGGILPRGKRTVIRGSYRQLQAQALDPSTLGLPTAEQYAIPGYDLTPYHQDLELPWVWGYSFQQQRPILVPEPCVYYGSSGDIDGTPHVFVRESSNGCALGNCLEEAIFFGILELAERDAFLVTWYARLNLPRLVSLYDAQDSTCRFLLEHIEHTTGYTVHVYDATLDHAAPCVLTLAVDNENDGTKPKALISAGSHPDPEQALMNALHELVTRIHMHVMQWPEQRERAAQLMADPYAIREIDDHPLPYCLPEAFGRLQFLTETPHQISLRDAFAGHYGRTAGLNLTDELRAVIAHYVERGTDVVVVDQTSAEHVAHNFRCVKVIMPGLAPMTFGHLYRRTSGLRRLLELPVTLGFRSTTLEESELNPYPHPFQ